MKKIIIAIIIILILCMIITGALLFMLKNSDVPVEENGEGDVGEDINLNEITVEPVTDNISFFSVQNCIQGYLNTINLKNSSYYDNEDKQIVTNNEIAEGICNLLSKEYIDENSITTSNVFNYIDKVEENLIFIPLKMNYTFLKNMTKYAIYGFCMDWDNNYVKDLYFIVNVDESNKTYSITPLNTEQYKSINDIKLDRKEFTIENKDNINDFILQPITDQYLCQQYFLLQKRLMLSRPEISYSYLDEEYKNKRFGSLENYNKYISENKAHILKMSIKGYEVERIGDTSQYMCKDQYGNYYIFNVEKVLDYKVLLDVYTIEQEKAIKAYNGYNNRKKIAYNVNKWVQMVNNKDYQGTYNLLNTTFRDNTWSTLEQFENFIKQNYPSYYEVEYGQYEENGESSVQTIILKDIEGKEENKTVTLIIKLKDEMNFEMSIAI
ncbi:MAG: hypothetical protein HFJ19_02030 [Clostridia bacterium]|nr:hypothetical protein [Clostridia bacterium]